MRSRRLLISCSCLALLGVVAAITGGLLYAGRTLSDKLARIEAFGPVAQRLPEELAAAKREGLPLDAADLRRVPPVPPSRNAAPIYVRITQTLNARPKAQADADSAAMGDLLKGARTHLDRAAVDAMLAKYGAVVRLAGQASALPDCDFQRRFELGPNLMLPELASMRTAGRLLALKACVQSADRDVAGAFRSVSACARIGRHAGRDPILIAMLVRIALDAIADRAFQYVLLAHRDSPEAVSLARRTVADFGEAPDLSGGIGGEIVMCRVGVSDIRKGLSPLDDLNLPAELRAQGAVTRAAMCDGWEARSISYWRRVVGVLRAKHSDMLAQYRAFKAVGDEEAANDGKPTYELNAVLLPVFSQVALKVMSDEAMRRLRAVTIDLVAYHQAHHAFPASIGDLGAKARLDPFTNRPFVYRLGGSGFVLYSVGQNFRDDGGIYQRANEKEKMLDIVVRYPPTP